MAAARKKKVRGDELAVFWEEWPPGKDWYVEGEGLEDDDGVVRFDSEFFYSDDELPMIQWQGTGHPPEDAPINGRREVSFLRWFAYWHSGNHLRYYRVAIPAGEEERFLQKMAENGWEAKK